MKRENAGLFVTFPKSPTKLMLNEGIDVRGNDAKLAPFVTPESTRLCGVLFTESVEVVELHVKQLHEETVDSCREIGRNTVLIYNGQNVYFVV